MMLTRKVLLDAIVIDLHTCIRASHSENTFKMALSEVPPESTLILESTDIFNDGHQVAQVLEQCLRDWAQRHKDVRILVTPVTYNHTGQW